LFKAVKRIRREEVKEVVNETLTELVGIATLVVKMYAIRRQGRLLGTEIREG
jgi:hypothetical protein